MPLSQLPTLRLVNLYNSQLWHDDLHMHPVQDRDQSCFQPHGVGQHLLFLQRTLRHIEFVVDSLQPFDWHTARASDLVCFGWPRLDMVLWPTGDGLAALVPLIACHLLKPSLLNW